MIVSTGVAVLRRAHESLILEVAVPDASERLDVPHFGRAEVDLAVRADEHGLAKLQFSDLSVPTPEITWKSWRRQGPPEK
jgi:hypothetical protein